MQDKQLLRNANLKQKQSEYRDFFSLTVFASDWHYGEVVYPAQINGMNEFNLRIADKRIQTFVESTISLLFEHTKNPEYDGLVFALGGDMFSGTIHEELKETNEEEMFPVVIDLLNRLIWVVDQFLEYFDRIHIPVVVGNHGRTSRKPVAKNRAFQNFDWLLGSLLAGHFSKDKRVTFQISEGPDATYSIYGRRYLLTHGDQFRGGDGIIGPIGTVIRGNHRKSMRELNVNKPYDTLICGHWHQLTMLDKIIINGSLKGYDEYAYTNNFNPESPQQALWITHPDGSIRIKYNILLEKENGGRQDNNEALTFQNDGMKELLWNKRKVAYPKRAKRIHKKAKKSRKFIKKRRKS